MFLLADHLGSTSVVADASNNVITTQNFDPWGAIRSGAALQTSVNYTGQRRDDTGLLYYHSRYYNPVTAHFLSPDSIVPGTASTRPLTVDFHEPGFTSRLNQENAFTQGQGFWFQLSSNAQSMAKQPWGPANPQALNRYSYVLGNPLRYTDASGHDYCTDKPGCGGGVTNNSSHSVWIYGNHWVPNNPYDPASRDPANGQGRFVEEWVELPAGYSSEQLGMYDVDEVTSRDPQHQIDGHSTNEVFKLGSNTKVTIKDDPNGGAGLRLEYQAKDFWAWFGQAGAQMLHNDDQWKICGDGNGCRDKPYDYK